MTDKKIVRIISLVLSIVLLTSHIGVADITRMPSNNGPAIMPSAFSRGNFVRPASRADGLTIRSEETNPEEQTQNNSQDSEVIEIDIENAEALEQLLKALESRAGSSSDRIALFIIDLAFSPSSAFAAIIKAIFANMVSTRSISKEMRLVEEALKCTEEGDGHIGSAASKFFAAFCALLRKPTSAKALAAFYYWREVLIKEIDKKFKKKFQEILNKGKNKKNSRKGGSEEL